MNRHREKLPNLLLTGFQDNKSDAQYRIVFVLGLLFNLLFHDDDVALKYLVHLGLGITAEMVIYS